MLNKFLKLDKLMNISLKNGLEILYEIKIEVRVFLLHFIINKS